MKQIKNTKLTIQLIIAVIVTLSGLTLLFCGEFIEPKGVIDNSNLVALGECFTFAGALFGVDYHYKVKTLINKLAEDERNQNKGENTQN